MKRGVFMDKWSVLEGLSMKRGVFMDKWPVLEGLSMKMGDFMDEAADEHGRNCVKYGFACSDSGQVIRKAKK